MSLTPVSHIPYGPVTDDQLRVFLEIDRVEAVYVPTARPKEIILTSSGKQDGDIIEFRLLTEEGITKFIFNPMYLGWARTDVVKRSDPTFHDALDAAEEKGERLTQ